MTNIYFVDNENPYEQVKSYEISFGRGVIIERYCSAEALEEHRAGLTAESRPNPEIIMAEPCSDEDLGQNAGNSGGSGGGSEAEHEKSLLEHPLVQIGLFGLALYGLSKYAQNRDKNKPDGWTF